jgi:WD40 repeat protein
MLGDNAVRRLSHLYWFQPIQRRGESQLQRNVFSKEMLRAFRPDASSVVPTANSGIRCIVAGPDGRFFVSGDRAGNIHVHEFASMETSCVFAAHETEVLCLAICSSRSGGYVIASGGRDRLLHVFSSKGLDLKTFSLLQTLDEHTSSITAVRFAAGGGILVSCSADKSIIFRSLHLGTGKYHQYQRALVAGGALFDMDIDPTQRHVVTSGEDTKLSIGKLETKLVRCGCASLPFVVQWERRRLPDVDIGVAGSKLPC